MPRPFLTRNAFIGAGTAVPAQRHVERLFTRRGIRQGRSSKRLWGGGGVEALERAWTVVRLRRGAEVADTKLVHELLDERRTLVAHEPLPAPELVAARAPVEAPVAEGVNDRKSLDTGFSQAVASALPPHGGAAGEDPCLDEPHEAVGEDVRGDALDRPGEQRPKVAAVAEDDVAKHEQRPAISEHLDGGVDRTPGPWFHDSSLTGISSSL